MTDPDHFLALQLDAVSYLLCAIAMCFISSTSHMRQAPLHDCLHRHVSYAACQWVRGGAVHTLSRSTTLAWLEKFFNACIVCTGTLLLVSRRT